MNVPPVKLKLKNSGVRDFKKKYDECNIYAEHKMDKAQAHNEISNENIFKNFLP